VRRRWRCNGRLAAPAAIALLAAGLLAGCGGAGDDGARAGASGGGGAGAATGDRGAQAVKFAACMRENGVPDFPDPVDGRIVMRAGPGGIEVDEATLEAAHAACQEFAPAGRADEQMQQQLLAFTQCMRDNGVPDFPDPQGPGRLLVPRSIDVQSPQFQQAHQTCQGELEGSGWGEGEGGVGG
jgi:hypothetical protein